MNKEIIVTIHKGCFCREVARIRVKIKVKNSKKKRRKNVKF